MVPRQIFKSRWVAEPSFQPSLLHAIHAEVPDGDGLPKNMAFCSVAFNLHAIKGQTFQFPQEVRMVDKFAPLLAGLCRLAKALDVEEDENHRRDFGR